jgi:transposase
MEYAAIDLHARRSEIRIVDDGGTVVLERRIDTRREELTRVFGERAPLRILVESSTESEWVAQHLETLGHELIVADPNYLPMYGARSRKVKSDRRDVAGLAEANRTGVFRCAHRASAGSRRVRQTMDVRRHLVTVRSETITRLRAILRREGWRLAKGAAETTVARLDRLSLPTALSAVIAPLREFLIQLAAVLTPVEEAVEDRAGTDVVAQRLMTAPGVGPVVALTYAAVLDDPSRFGGDAARASAFLGLVPSEHSSGERRHQGHITKTGPRQLRALLVQASWVIWRGRSGKGAALREWAHALAARRGRRIAIVALARRLSRMLYAMWRDARDFTTPPRRAAVVA